MVFSSLPFVYGFFPLVMVLYFLCPNRVWRNGVLLTASLVFYGWGEPRMLALMLCAALAAYLGGLGIAWADRSQRGQVKRGICAATVTLLVGNLFVFKYLNFAVDNLNLLLGDALAVPAIALPIGISFYTFQILSYVIDLYRGKVEVQRNYFYLLLYVSFFPQLIAGPIVRYQTVEHEIRRRQESLEDVAEGMRRFILGLGKKVILANNVAAVAEVVYAGDPGVYGGAMYWVAALAYTLQIYFDFSGYSDMAIGLGRVFGFHFLENFDHPYVSLSITDFWRRWHISLSSWFRDYVYIPLGGNRVSRGRWVFNLLVVWGLTGLWHGAQWNFLLWGLYYGVLLLLEKMVWGGALEKLPKAIRWVYAMFFVVVGWVLFNRTEPAQLGLALKTMFTWPGTDWLGVVTADADVLAGLIYLPMGLFAMFPWGKWLRRWGIWKGDGSARETVLADLGCLALAAVSVVFIISSQYNPFIYFRF